MVLSNERICEPTYCSILFLQAIHLRQASASYLMGYALCRRPPIIAHCFRIADSWHCCKRVLVFFGTQTYHLVWLVASLWRPGGLWADFGTQGSITKDTLRSRPGFVPIFGGFCCPWVLFGMLGASTLASWGTLGRSWDIRDYKTGHCEVQAWILSIFCWFRGPI